MQAFLCTYVGLFKARDFENAGFVKITSLPTYAMQKIPISAENSLKKDLSHVTCHKITRWRLQIFAYKV